MLNNDVQSPPRLVCMVHSGQLKACAMIWRKPFSYIITVNRRKGKVLSGKHEI